MSYIDKTSAQMVDPQPAPTEGVPGSDAWLDAVLYAEGYYAAAGNPYSAAPGKVLEDMKYRRELGIAKYGCPLQYASNRDNVIDGYQELLDMYVYFSAEAQKAITPAWRTACNQLRKNALEQLVLIRSM